MNATILHLAGAVARPRSRRPTCEGSRALVAAGCVHNGRAWCPTCHGEVDAEPTLPRVVRLRVHRGAVR